MGGMTCVPHIVKTVKTIFCREPFKGSLLAGNVTDILFLSLITWYVISVFWHHKVDKFVGVEMLSGIMAKLISQHYHPNQEIAGLFGQPDCYRSEDIPGRV